MGWKSQGELECCSFHDRACLGHRCPRTDRSEQDDLPHRATPKSILIKAKHPFPSKWLFLSLLSASFLNNCAFRCSVLFVQPEMRGYSSSLKLFLLWDHGDLFFSPHKSHWSQIILRLEWGWASLTFSVQIWEQNLKTRFCLASKGQFPSLKSGCIQRPIWLGSAQPELGRSGHLMNHSLRRCPSWRRITLAFYEGQVK